MSSFHYTLSGDFPDGLDIGALHYSIVNGIPGGDLLGITQNDNDVQIDFGVVLDAGQQTTLNNIITNYVFSVPSRASFDTVTINTPRITSDEYQVVGIYNFKGLNTAIVSNITYGSYMQGNLTSYNMRIYDKTNDEYVAESLFSNVDDQPQTIDTFGNLSYDKSYWEFQTKRNGGDQFGTVVINFVNINY